jgi:hypothetical protein
MELRAHVLTGRFCPASLSLSTLSSNACWTKGPFFSERAIGSVFQMGGKLLLSVTILNNELVRILFLIARLFTLCMTPWAEQVLTTTTGF